MSGSAGLSPSRSRKPEGSTLSGYARNLRKECAGLVAGQAVLTAEIRIEAVEDLWTDLDRALRNLPKAQRVLITLVDLKSNAYGRGSHGRDSHYPDGPLIRCRRKAPRLCLTSCSVSTTAEEHRFW